MKIFLYTRSGYDLIIEDDNVHIVEDIEERTYHKTEDGKADYSRPPERDIQTEALDRISVVLQDMIYYRNKDYDSSALIGSLFEKLPHDSLQKLLVTLKSEYDEIE